MASWKRQVLMRKKASEGRKKKKKKELDFGRKWQNMKPWEEALTVKPQSLYILFLFLRKYLNTYLYLATSLYKELMSIWDGPEKGLQLFQWLL